MQTRRTDFIAIGATATAIVLMALSTSHLAAWGAGQRGTAPARPPARDSFRADLTIRHATVRADGQPAGPAAPAATLRLDRRDANGRWRTTLTLQRIERPEIRGLATGSTVDNPFQVVRMEYDEDGTPPRMYDRHGRLVRLPRAEDRRLLHTPATLAAGLPVIESLAGRTGPAPPALVGSSWIDAVIVPPAGRASRRAALERQLGRPVGQVRGLDRFLTRVGDATHEVLVDATAAVPVEVNATRQGRLAARTTFTYARDGAGALVGRTTRTERTTEVAGERTVLTTELANIEIGVGGAR
jgi:YD repeat-containing protein